MLRSASSSQYSTQPTSTTSDDHGVGAYSHHVSELELGLYESLVTDELLATRARTDDEMELVSAFCSFVERAN